MSITAETLMLAAGCGGFLLTLLWVRRRQLSERHALGWMGVATLLLLCGVFPHLITAAAEACHLSYPSAVLFIALGLGYVFAFGVSVGYTKLSRRNTALLQHLALLEQRVRELEGQEPPVQKEPTP